MTTFGIDAVHGVPQSALTLADLQQLPASAPPPPWNTSMRAVLWFARPTGAAGRAASLVGGGRPAMVVGAMVDYDDTPVGPYREIIGGVGLASVRGLSLTVPFIAVDSPTSVVGGRVNWALPKTACATCRANCSIFCSRRAGWRRSALPSAKSATTCATC